MAIAESIVGVAGTVLNKFVADKDLKAKFKVYPSAYANMYGSAVCSGKVTPGGKKGSRKKAMGGGMMDMTRMRYLKGGQV